MKTNTEIRVVFENDSVGPPVTIRRLAEHEVVELEQGGHKVWIPCHEFDDFVTTLSDWSAENIVRSA